MKATDRTFPITDRLYGAIRFPRWLYPFFETRELARLRHVSLSAVPPWAIPVGTCATKFEHSLGATHLAVDLSITKGFRAVATDLILATLIHDIGTPPFSHVSEIFQVALLGKTHEAFAEEFLSDSEFAKLAKKTGGNVSNILAFVKGTKPPFSDLVNGSIDLDNLDNSLRFAVSTGLLQKNLYSPERLALSFAYAKNELSLRQPKPSDLNGWEATRITAYEFVHSDQNLAPGAMLLRALHFAAQENQLPKEYFTFTDETAFTYLSTKCNKRTRLLMERIDRWEFYTPAFKYTSVTPSAIIRGFIEDYRQPALIAEALSRVLAFPPEDIAIFLGKDKGFKQIHLPIYTRRGTVSFHTPHNRERWFIRVYVHPHLNDKLEVIRDYMETLFLQ